MKQGDLNEKPHEKILDRVVARVHIKENFIESLDLVKQIVNYGTNLIVRCFASSEKKIKDVVIINSLLQQAVTMLDAVEILVSHGAVHPSSLQTRVLFEIRLYLAWIFHHNTTQRAHQYYVGDLRQRALLTKRSIPGTPEHQRYADSPGITLDGADFTKVEEDARRELYEIENILEKDDFKEINEKFKELKNPNSDLEIAWYSPGGPSSISDMAFRLNIHGEYKVLYNYLSKSAHSTDFNRNFRMGGNSIKFKTIRNLENIHIIIRLSISYTIMIYQMTLKYYRPEELTSYSEKYRNEWKQRIYDIKGVRYK
jgi:Family of unknown function (DUF5677)